MGSTRITRTELFMQTAELVSKRSSCLKMSVGCVAVIDNRVIASGYNGVLPGIDPIEGMDEDGNTHTIHAEANLVSFCARKGIAIEDSIIYITLSPCRKCAELLIQAKVKSIVYLNEYRDKSGIELLQRCGVSVNKYK